jgi:hypothetical protein
MCKQGDQPNGAASTSFSGGHLGGQYALELSHHVSWMPTSARLQGIIPSEWGEMK